MCGNECKQTLADFVYSLANIMQTQGETQGRNFFSVRAFGADDRISNPKKFSGESISQSAQSSKFEIHRECVFSM